MDRTVLSLMEFYRESGVDIALEETPRDHFAETRARTEARAASTKAQADAILDRVRDTPSRGGAEPAAAAAVIRPSAEPAGVEAAAAAREAAAGAGDLAALRLALERFEGCGLKRTAKSLVFADGNPQAPVMLVGEAPGRDEDIAGRAFAGRAGDLLDRMLGTIGLDRGSAYVVHAIPWRPPGNRPPNGRELEICRPFIERQIELAAPRLLVLLGGLPAQHLLRSSEPVARLRGKWQSYRTGDRDIPAMISFDPAYLLRQPTQKRLAWHDLLELREKLAGLDAQG